MWTSDRFLKMMQVNSGIFGKDILDIKDASDDFLCRYFRSSLCKLLCPFTKIDPELFDIHYSGKGDISKTVPKFSLTVEQCVTIGNFLLPCCLYDKILSKYVLTPWDSQIVLNYIKFGYPCDRWSYRLALKNDANS